MLSTSKNPSSATKKPSGVKKWTAVPEPSAGDLRNRMVEMYWEGVVREVVCMLRTLRCWQQECFAGVAGEDEELSAEAMRGFDTFVERAAGVGRREVLRNVIQERILQMERDARGLSVDQRRARMLLQGAGFLDIDKIIEYREPLEGYGLWVRPRATQLALADYNPINHLPNFRPSVCSECFFPIRGAEFRHPGQIDQNPPPGSPSVFCEKCSRDKDYKTTGYLRKYEKRCILREVVPPEQIRKICSCGVNNSPQDDEGQGGDESTTFAVDGGQIHLPHCPILQLKKRHVQAKLDELKYQKEMFEAHRRNAEKNSVSYRISSVLPNKLGEKVLGWTAKSVAPPNIPFGNIHMALMVGTIIIENGVPGSKKGALISIRDSPVYYDHLTKEGEVNLLAVSPKRKVFYKQGIYKKLRIKACMKQVVGGVFTGLSDEVSELEIVDALVRESQRCVYDPMKVQDYDNARLRAAAHRIVLKLQGLLGNRVTWYFDTLAAKLFTVELRFNIFNNCQQFCANILDFKVFGSFLATTPTCRLHTPVRPHYLVSFTCAPGSYDAPHRVKPQSKRDAPNGLTEEYLLRFRRYGHHEESDIIDTLLEYWHDWGAFGGPIYRHQGLFPWDCTEAYRVGEDNGKCNSCNMASHVWSFPFDAWSIVQLHLLRERAQYSPHSGSTRKRLSDEQWMHNRLTTLSALNALNTVAVAMAKTPSFRAACRWNRERTALTPETASKLDRIKLSGIHRAQPYSHDFDKTKYHDCTLADWALLKREDQIRAYEVLRDHRADKLVDIPPAPKARQHRHRSRHPAELSKARNNADAEPSMQDDNLAHHHDRDHDHDSWSDIYGEDEDYTAEDAGYEPGGGLIPDSFGADPCDDPNDYAGLCGCNGDGRDDDEYPNFDYYAREPYYHQSRSEKEEPIVTSRVDRSWEGDLGPSNDMLGPVPSTDPGTWDTADPSNDIWNTADVDDFDWNGGFLYEARDDSWSNNNGDGLWSISNGGGLWGSNNDDGLWGSNNDDGLWSSNNDSGWWSNNDSGWWSNNDNSYWGGDGGGSSWSGW